MSENPYAAPIQNPSGNTARQISSKYQYKPIRPLAKILIFSIGFICLGNVAVSAMETLGEVIFPGFSDPNAMLSSESERYFLLAIAAAGLLILPAFILSIVLTPMLFYRANANLRSLGVRGLQHTPGWCAGYWFIPIISLFKPYQVAVEIDEFSRSSGSWLSPPPIGLWWAFWLISNFLSNIETRLVASGNDLGSGGLILSWTASLLTCVAGYLFIKVIFSFANSQEALLKEDV